MTNEDVTDLYNRVSVGTTVIVRRALTDATGKITGVTYVHASSGGITGKIISRGNLVSFVRSDGGLSGLIAAQGDIGTIQRDANGKAVVGSDAAKSLVRFGGLLINGGLGGQVIALGNAFGDINVNGVTGRIAVRGQQVAGLDPQRYGILGKLVINGAIGSTAAIVSAGVIGDDGVYVGTDSDANGTQLNITGNETGIIAAESDINFGKTGKLTQSGIFENASAANKAAIDAIFTQGGTPLTFDSNGKTGLDLILQDLAALRVGTDGNLTGPVK
jgi:hypothetical protein